MKSVSTHGASVSLVAYAAREKLSYLAALNRILMGKVVGWQDERGRWRVAAGEVRAAGGERSGSTPTPAPTA